MRRAEAAGWCATAPTTRSPATPSASGHGSTAAATHEGEFDFDPTRLDAAAAVDAFLQNHIEKADWDAAP